MFDQFAPGPDRWRSPINRIRRHFAGEGVGARARRSTIWSFADFGGSQALRFASNLILTRLLFPEAFGIMALVSVVTAGLTLFSDTGVRSLIIQNARGDDPDFLNTAWTIQAFRSLILWLMTVCLAFPVATLYNEPVLATILPVAGLSLLIDGFKPTSVYTVNRNLALGRFIQIKMITQVMGLVVMALLAWQMQSVWALVIGNVFTSLIGIIAFNAFLPGLRNRFRLEREAVRQIFHFGKWIFLSTAASFLMSQGDRAILGLYISLEALGIYNIGYFLASIPLLLSRTLHQTIMFPLYRMKPPSESDGNRKSLFHARRLIASTMLAGTALLSLLGPPLVGLLYDPRYASAGAMITLFALSVVPLVSLSTIGEALMGAGDTKGVFIVAGATALFQTLLLIFGVQNFGVPGALLAPGLAILASYPLRLRYSIKYGVFDPIQDVGLTLIGLIIPLISCALYWSDINALFT